MPAEECVSYNDEGENDHGPLIGHSGEDHSNYGGTCDKGRCNIYGKCNQEYDRTDHLQGLVLGFEPVGQILRQGDRVISRLTQFAKTSGTEDPVKRGAQRQTDTDPDLSETKGQYRTGQAHQQPGGHIGSLCRHGGDPGAHGTAAKEIVLLVLVAAVKVKDKSYKKQNDKIA